MTRPLAVLLAALLLALAGCGGDDGEEGGAPASDGGGESTTLTLTADPEGGISWEPAELTAPAGIVDIELVNESDTPHAVQLEGQSLPAELEPGEYTYFCPVGEHRENGMEGTLTVE